MPILALGDNVMRYEVVDGYGSQVLKHSERLILRRPVLSELKTTEKREVPVLHLDHLLIGTKGVLVSTDALALCCERGIPITVVDWRGRPVGRFSTPALHGTARIRREGHFTNMAWRLARSSFRCSSTAPPWD